MIGAMLLWFSLSLGLQESMLMINNNLQINAPFYTELEIHAENSYIDLYGVYKNEMNKSDGLLEFAPSQDYYKVGATAKYKNFALNIEHECVHPVVTNGVTPSTLYGGHTKFEVTLSSKKD